MLIELTSSQLMALRDLLLEHVTMCAGRWCPTCERQTTEQFIDCSSDPPVVTTPEDLLRVLTEQVPA